MIIFDILVSLFEGAYLKYAVASHKVRDTQWTGWNSCVRDWCKREDFRVAWAEWLNKEEYDKDFLSYMDGMIEKAVDETTAQS